MPERNPEVPITLDKLRHLRLDINAMATFEELTGLNLLKPSVQKQLGKDMNITQFRALLYACLIHEDKTLTLEQVGSLISIANMKEVAAGIAQAQQLAVGGKEDTHPLA